MWWGIAEIAVVVLGVAAVYLLVALGVSIAAPIHAARTPEPETLADAIREQRRARLRKAFPGLLPEDRRRGGRFRLPGSSSATR